MSELIFSLNATIPVFLIMIIGYLLYHFRLLKETSVDEINRINYLFFLPVLLFQDLSSTDFKTMWNGKYVLFCFLVTIATILILLILTLFFFRKKEKTIHDLSGEFIQASYRSSAAILGIAFLINIYGNSGMAPLMIIGSVPLYNIAAVFLLYFTSPTLENKGDILSLIRSSFLGVFTNPIILGILTGILASFLPFEIPAMLDKTLEYLAKLATPLALICLGAGFRLNGTIKLIKLTTISSLIKLLIIPVLFLPLAISFGFRNQELTAILIMLGSPTTISAYVMGKNMGHEGTLTSGVIIFTTLFSSLSLTFFIYILRFLGYI